MKVDPWSPPMMLSEHKIYETPLKMIITTQKCRNSPKLAFFKLGSHQNILHIPNRLIEMLSERQDTCSGLLTSPWVRSATLWVFYIIQDQISSPGSVCPSSIPPTPGQPCTLPGELDCHYENEDDCCGNCNAQNFTISCVPDNATTGAGLWQMSSPPCPTDCCGSEGEWCRECFFLNLHLLDICS